MATFYSLDDLEYQINRFSDTPTDDSQEIASILQQCLDVALDAEDSGHDPLEAIRGYYNEVKQYLVENDLDVENSFELNTIRNAMGVVEDSATEE